MKVVKDNVIVNRINRTKEERHPDLAALQEQRAVEFRAQQKEAKKAVMLAEKNAQKARLEVLIVIYG